MLIIFALPILILAILFLSGCNGSNLETLNDSKFPVSNTSETPDSPNDSEPDFEDENSTDKTNSKNPDSENKDSKSDDNNTGDDSPSDDDRTLPDDDDRTLPDDDDRTLPDDDDSKDDSDDNKDSNKPNESSDDDLKDDDSKSDDSADENPDDEVVVSERKLEIKLTTFEDKFSYTFSNGVIYKSLGTNNAVYLSFELFENSIKVSGARFEILVSTSDVTFDEVNYNSVYMLILKSCEFDLTIKTVDGKISKTIHVVVS